MWSISHGNVAGKLGNAYLRYQNRQSATCFPLAATPAMLAIPVLPVNGKRPRLVRKHNINAHSICLSQSNFTISIRGRISYNLPCFQKAGLSPSLKPLNGRIFIPVVLTCIWFHARDHLLIYLLQQTTCTECLF